MRKKVIVALNTAEMTPVSLATQELIDEKASLKSVFYLRRSKCEDGKMSLPPRSWDCLYCKVVILAVANLVHEKLLQGRPSLAVGVNQFSSLGLEYFTKS